MLRKLMISVVILFSVLFAQESNIAGTQDNGAINSVSTTNESSGQDGIKKDAEKVTELEGKVNGLEESYLETKSIVSKLAKLKVSGYIQAQWQHAETLGVQTSVAGSKFDKETDNRFFIRRGRIKFNYDNGLNQYVLQFDASSSGFEIKDAYLTLTEPWMKYFTATMGIFDRPFGYEISYSSSMRESPERSRVYQTLFPKEREIGAKLAFAADKGVLSYFNFKGGIFNGVTPLQLDNDGNKDFIGRVGFEIPLRDIGMGIDGGFSTYLGKVTNTDTMGTKTVVKVDSSSWVTKVLSVDSAGNIKWSASKKRDTTYSYSQDRGAAYEMDGTVFKKKIGQKGKDFDRQYFGLDLQYYFDIPVIGGLTLRGEYLWGVQPGTSSSSSFYQPSAGGTPNGAIYSRNFAGAYLYWVQCWGSKVQSVVKYDYYDPNVDVKEDEIGATGSGTSITDLAFKTYGAGLIYNWDENLKFMLYYDVPRNETSNALSDKKYAHDLKDNVITLRVQYKF
jgi:hypothetical protein